MISSDCAWKVSPAGVIQKLHDFTFAEGGHPYGRLTLSADHSRFLGVTRFFGPFGNGSIYQYAGGVFTVLAGFAGNIGYPSPVALGADGVTFYGVEGVESRSTARLFAIDPDGTGRIVKRFDGWEPAPAALLLAPDGSLLGASEIGGKFKLGKIVQVSGY